MAKRNSEAIWNEKQARWICKVQKEGVRKSFASSIKGRKGKHEAEGKADIWLASGTADMRFPAAWATYLEHTAKHTGTANHKKVESLGRLYILPTIGQRKLSAVTPNLWQQCIENGADAGLSRRSCRNIKITIGAFLTYCDSNRWAFERLNKNDLTIPNRAAPPVPKIVLQPNDIRMLFTDPTITKYHKSVHAHYIYAWRLYVVTGLRRGELAGLLCEDIADSMIVVQRSINSDQEETTGKNDNARRAIALSAVAQSVLNDQAAMLKRAGIISPWVFPDTQGQRSNPNSIYKQWCTYREQHGLHSSIHELRHTFVSASKSDMPLDLLKATVGHSQSMDTLGVYGHELDGEKQRAAGIVDSVFGQILNYSPMGTMPGTELPNIAK